MLITLLLLIILVRRWVCEHRRNNPLQDISCSLRMEKFSRYHVAAVWLSGDGFASANADYSTITQQHTAFTAILPCSRRQQENTCNRLAFTYHLTYQLQLASRLCVSRVTQITYSLLVNVMVRWSDVLVLQLNPKKQKENDCLFLSSRNADTTYLSFVRVSKVMESSENKRYPLLTEARWVKWLSIYLKATS